MNKFKKIYESIINEYNFDYDYENDPDEQNSGAFEMTPDEFFSWYTEDPNWDKDWQTTNSMSINDKHVQDEGNELEYLSQLKQHTTPVVFKYEKNSNGNYDIEFTLDNTNIWKFESQDIPEHEQLSADY